MLDKGVDEVRTDMPTNCHVCLSCSFIVWLFHISNVSIHGRPSAARTLMTLHSAMLPRCIFGISNATVTDIPRFNTIFMPGSGSTIFCFPSMAYNRSADAFITKNVKNKDEMNTKKVDINMRVSKMGVQMADEEATVLLTTNVYRHGSNPDKQQRVTIKITEAENTLFRLLKECIAFNSLKLGMFAMYNAIMV